MIDSSCVDFSRMVSMVFVSWELMLFEGMVVGFEKHNYVL